MFWNSSKQQHPNRCWALHYVRCPVNDKPLRRYSFCSQPARSPRCRIQRFYCTRDAPPTCNQGCLPTSSRVARSRGPCRRWSLAGQRPMKADADWPCQVHLWPERGGGPNSSSADKRRKGSGDRGQSHGSVPPRSGPSDRCPQGPRAGQRALIKGHVTFLGRGRASGFKFALGCVRQHWRLILFTAVVGCCVHEAEQTTWLPGVPFGRSEPVDGTGSSLFMGLQNATKRCAPFAAPKKCI